MHDPTARDGLEVPEAAVDALAVWDLGGNEAWEQAPEHVRSRLRGEWRDVVEVVCPHIRRAVIEELIANLGTRIESLASQMADCFDRDEAYALGDDLDHYGVIRGWLRAELEEGDGRG